MITEISTDLTKKYVKKILEKNYDKLETSAAKDNQLIGSGIVVYVLDNLKFTTTGKLKSAGKVDFYKTETKLITTLKKYKTKILVVTDLKAYKILRQELLPKNNSDGEISGKIQFKIPDTDVHVRLIEFPVFQNNFARKFGNNQTLTFSQILSAVKFGFLEIKDLPTDGGKLLHLDDYEIDVQNETVKFFKNRGYQLRKYPFYEGK